MNHAITDVPGFHVGHAQDLQGATGCTVVLCPPGTVGGLDVRGSAAGTRQTDSLHPYHSVDEVHAVLLAGGSAFGLDAAAGVMKYLEEQGVGFDVRVTRVPIVCGAALFDLTIGDHRVRPDKRMGYQACLNASTSECVQGSVGAGTGATVGKILGMGRAVKGGMGCFTLQAGELKVGALVAVNCLGDVVDPVSGRKLAGPLKEDLRTFADTEAIMIAAYADTRSLFSGNTTIGVVATNAALTKPQAAKLASMAQNGYARTMRPAHSMYDGDTIFAMSTGDVAADLSVVGLLAARVMERAVIAAIENAASLCGVRSVAELETLR